MDRPCGSSVRILLALVAFGLLPHLGQAAMLRLSLAQLARQADTIVLGTVIRQVSAWNAQHTAIYTDVTLAVEQVIAGIPGAEVTFRIAGGVVGGMGMRTSNDPVFHEGERVIVFLDTSGSPTNVVGLAQGKCPVTDGMVTWGEQTLTVEAFSDAIRAVRR